MHILFLYLLNNAKGQQPSENVKTTRQLPSLLTMFSYEFQTIQNHLQHAIYFEIKKPSMSLGFEFSLVWEGMTLPFIAQAQKSHTQ